YRMPRKGSSRQADRSCLVCGEKTRIAHLGIDVCRACAVFYRRAEEGNNFVCRSNTNSCQLGKGLNCKRCRFDNLVRLRCAQSRTLVAEHSVSRQQPQQKPPLLAANSGEASVHPSPSTSAYVPQPLGRRPLLDSLAAHYRSMSYTRLNSELNARPDPPHPLSIGLDRGPFYKATYGALNQSVRVLLSASLEFGRNVFPDFAAFPEDEQWKMVVSFFYRFRVIEGCHRAIKLLPEADKFFSSYTTIFGPAVDDDFFNDAPPCGDREGAMKYMKQNTWAGELAALRESVARLALSHDEFLAIVALMFWSIEEAEFREEVVNAAERYKHAVLKELHAYYREVMRLDDYAARLGELMMLLQVLEKTKEAKEHFELLRLFGVMPEDNFIYRLQKE
ncbi:hypothetical protein PFISCL1PPCAC_13137, partial [Pristionchus fissidentatus]